MKIKLLLAAVTLVALLGSLHAIPNPIHSY